MRLEAIASDLAHIEPYRAQFLEACRVQMRYHACHARGWTDSYLLTRDATPVGYGSIKGQEIGGRDTVFEFFVIPNARPHASALFERMLAVSGASTIEAQSNDWSLSPMLFEFGRNISADVVLFEAGTPTSLGLPGATVRPRRDTDRIFVHTSEPIGDYVLEVGGEIVGTGGFLRHYNPPFADVHMEVAEPHRRKGAGSFLVQELIRECGRAGRVPAARCGIDNVASRAALTRAGLRPCGFLLRGDVRRPRGTHA